MLRRAMTSLSSTFHQRTRNNRKPYLAFQATQSSTAYKSTTTTATTEERSAVFRPWPTAIVESHGDYREEAWLEQHIGGPLYAQQSSLPHLPVVTSVPETLTKFLPTALPLARSDREVAALTAAVETFPAQAAVLQERLVQRAEEFDATHSSWLQQWWNTWGYLQVRDPVMINVSYFFHFCDDPTASTQVQRAAAIMTATAQFRKLACSGQLPPEVIGKGDRKKALCAVAYKYMFHACRIPALEQDAYRIHDPSRHHHAVVAVQGHLFRVDLVDPVTADPRPVRELEAALQECIDLAAAATAAAVDCGDDDDDHAIGWCTSSNRDDWAKARGRLLEAGGKDMADALQTLESGAMLVCLDDETPVSRAQVGQMLLHGSCSSSSSSSSSRRSTVKGEGGGNGSGGNRWFDKSIQLIVSKNGKAGLLGEHSMMDGMPMVRLADHITKTTYADVVATKENQHDAITSNSSIRLRRPAVQPIFSQALRDRIRGTAAPLVEKAKHDFADLVTNNSLHVQSFQGYGSTFMKHAGYSPDAYVQVAIQLATYRLWGEQVGTYEATQVRPFLHGRTETTRSVSIESAAFVQKLGLVPAMDEHEAATRKEKLRLLTDAVNAHVKYIGQAAQARGVDRHFLGLSMLVRDGETPPDLYSDPVFQRSKRWRVSTSHLTHPKFDNWGYGQVVPDGVGLAYSIHARHCMFNITALKETGWTDKLSQLLEEALLEMRALIEMDQTQPPVSKL